MHLRWLQDMVRYPQHLRSFDYTGFHRYFLTFCTHERRLYFRQVEHVSLVRAQILRVARLEQFELIAYCFMPDHVHLLASGLDAAAALKSFIKGAKQHSGYYFTRHTGCRLWQRYGFEHVLRSEEATFFVARYIIENPLRAGRSTRWTRIRPGVRRFIRERNCSNTFGPPKGGPYSSDRRGGDGGSDCVLADAIRANAARHEE